jgi:hypothetical protein
VREVAAHAHPYFRELFDDLHGRPFGDGDALDVVDQQVDGADVEEGPPADDAEGETLDEQESAHEFAELPDSLVGPARTIHRWNNDLSLVLAATDYSFLAMGDVTSRWAVTGALEASAKHFVRMLAPHHGTHRDKDLPSADECFMQTGHSHSTRTHRHVAVHLQATHRCTHTTQKEGASKRRVGPCRDPGCPHPSTGGFFRR